MQRTLYWHDYETFGANPAFDRPSQFAGLRTDENLEVIGEPLVLYCQPQRDLLPSPEACMITGITPQLAAEKGLPEREFIASLHAQFSRPGTCGLGYNSIRFDDEVTRYTLYRNFYDPYEREWKDGNSRWDIIDMLRLARAIRPDGIQWPDHDDGAPSFRLEDLSAANNIGHESAHDALSDVEATLALARLVRKRRPQLFDYVYQNRGKHQVAALLDLKQRKPFLHVSGKLPREHLYCALMMPLVRHPTNANAVISFDLSADPDALIRLDAAQIHERVFTSSEQLAEGVERIPLKAVHLNRAPVVATPKLLDSQAAARLGIDLQTCEKHWRMLLRVDLRAKLREVFGTGNFPEAGEAEQRLYAGFVPEHDRALCAEVREASGEDLASNRIHFSDLRYRELLFHYRARNFPDTLTPEEQEQWLASCRWRLTDDSSGYLTLRAFRESVGALEQQALAGSKLELLRQLAEWADGVYHEFAITER